MKQLFIVKGKKGIFLIFFILLIHAGYCFSQTKKGPNKLYPILFNYARNLYNEYDKIPQERKVILEEIANYIIGSIQFEGSSDILIVGSNNSTRSIMVEAWANAAAYYYGIKNVHIYSGGIKPSHVATNAVIALEKAGFIIYKIGNDKNPSYEIKYSYNIPPVIVKSKKIDAKTNPDFKFGSVVVCANADINLPVIKGNNFRTSLHYYDPVAQEQSKEAIDQYTERSREIAIEMFYLFYKLKNAG
jgi:arsenate reductase